MESSELQHNARLALPGDPDREQITSSQVCSKKAQTLLEEAVMLNHEVIVANCTRNHPQNKFRIKEYAKKVVELLTKQDEISQQIAWLTATISELSFSSFYEALELDDYLKNINVYARSVYECTILDDFAEEMYRISLSNLGIGDSSNLSTRAFHQLPILSDETSKLMTILIGNTHRLVTPQTKKSSCNKHLWSFYLQASCEEIIHEVIICLHPTFTPPEVRLRVPPYKLTRIGWGYFIIDITIILKPAFLWHKEKSRTLKLEWELDFNMSGSSNSYAYTVINERRNAPNVRSAAGINI